MRWLWAGGASFSAILGLFSPGPAGAWDRGDVHNFATIPSFAPSGPDAACPNEAKSCTSDVEGVAVAPDGTVYSASYGYTMIDIPPTQMGDPLVSLPTVAR